MKFLRSGNEDLETAVALMVAEARLNERQKLLKRVIKGGVNNYEFLAVAELERRLAGFRKDYSKFRRYE